MSIRKKFVKDFGKGQAKTLENAAETHNTHVHNRKGSDPFKWVLLICIGYECFEKDAFRKYHKITIPFEKLKSWIKNNGQLGTHDGDCDYLSLIAGEYNEYIPKKRGAL